MELRSKGVNQSSVSEEEPLALAVQIRSRTKANETAGSGGYNRRRPPPNCERKKELQLLNCEKNDGAATPRRKPGNRERIKNRKTARN
jgi:hypothetical protein